MHQLPRRCTALMYGRRPFHALTTLWLIEMVFSLLCSCFCLSSVRCGIRLTRRIGFWIDYRICRQHFPIDVLLFTVLDRIVWRIVQSIQKYGLVGILLQGVLLSILSISPQIQRLPQHFQQCECVPQLLFVRLFIEFLFCSAGILCDPWISCASMAVVHSGLFDDFLHIDICDVGHFGTGIGAMAIENRSPVRVADDESVMHLFDYIKWVDFKFFLISWCISPHTLAAQIVVNQFLLSINRCVDILRCDHILL